jgi:catechol 2,3-dioxygenase-like lactoylglutathione lyase family enzyme
MTVPSNYETGGFKMTISYVVLFVKDIDASLSLYQNVLGLELKQRYTTEDGGEAAFLVEKGFTPMVDQPLLELVVDKSGKNDSPRGCLLGFEVASLDKATMMMNQKGFKKLHGPYSPEPSVKISTFEGPDNEIVELMQNL